MKGFDPDLRALQEVRDLVARAKAAVKAVAHYSQADVDRLCAAMAEAGARAAHDLARLAVQETGMGRVHYKILKNLLGSEGTWESIKNERTVGLLSSDPATGITEVAAPVGVVAGIIPSTNPTSSALFKGIIAVKGRNAMVLSPHPSARRCILEAAEVMRRAIARAGGPPDLVTCLEMPTLESTGALMKHRDVSVILATGGSGLVRAAYSSGKPAYGVGPGNVPAYVDRSANIRQVAEDLVTSQSFDNGTLCCSEQGLVVDAPVYDRLLAALRERGAHLCTPEEVRMLEVLCNQNGHMNAKVVGQDPWKVAEMAGFHVRRSTTVLLAPQNGVGPEHPLSIEILCPLLSVHKVQGWQEGCQVATAMLHLGGLGHTLSIHAQDDAVLEAFFLEKPASRIVVNGPSSQGATGFSTHLMPSFSLGCGPQAGNITSDNITAKHLIHIKRAAAPRADWKAIERRFHERAAAMTGEAAPRGSGLRGDPGLALASGSIEPASQPVRQPAPIAIPKVTLTPKPAPPSAPAPTFSRPSQAIATPRPAPPAQPAPTPTSTRLPERGASLTPAEIQGILEHAGAGCPMGPCQGCPHSDKTTGACRA
ncbi:MAG: aldehyde dehydrogenase family protein [Planctomycetes bacterium]|nr:aldehyde dehydrogenase family protein [Planctomycetota bacterium]MCB9908708.1 aldehyde dehydrogenase family protein [Planctomycetota bacterium]HPF13925.1 aldehyde dehydrogenase family protein [Planctomycetota bacterium]HRV81221.1 aldehyde dehydrogenase family protein [Planctomycetota bacterium]